MNTKMKMRMLSILLCFVMLVGLLPTTAFATGDGTSEATAIEVTDYATKTQLMDGTFAPNADGTAVNYGKIVFGKNSSGAPQEWYILGKDTGVSGDNTIIFAASPIATAKIFNSSIYNNTYIYDYEAGTGYGDSAGSKGVYPNHYGASNLRAVLKSMVDASNTSYFTTAEQGLMNATTVATKDTKNDVTYTTTDKLYALQGDLNKKQDLWAGTGDSTVLAVNSYWSSGYNFWLRSPYADYVNYALLAWPGSYVDDEIVDHKQAVQPASNLNLTSVLFASAATAASSDTVSGTITDGTAMTLRFDGTGKDIGTVTHNNTTGDIKATKGSTSQTVALVVQGNDGTNDWYYSKKIDTSKTVNASAIKSALGLSSDIDLSDCKIWLEITDTDGLIYAVSADKEQVAPTTYTVSFAANGGTGNMAAVNNVSGNYTLPPNGFTAPNGKQFKCWSVNGNEKNPFESISVTADVTVKAVWKDIVTTSYTVSFNSNGGSGSMASVNNAPSLYTLPANGFTPPANKQFKCWAVGAQNTEYDPGDKITITADVTVKAVWEAITSSRQVISDVVATSSDLDTIPTLYGLLKIPTFTVTQGAPAYINATTSNLRWQKKIAGVWTNQDSGRFTPGEWRISSSLRIDGTNGYHYELGNPTTLTVNGQAWTVENNGKPSVHPSYSHANILSPVFTIIDDPNIQPPVPVESVHMVLNGYTPGAAAASVTATTDANVTVEVLGFLEGIDSNGDGQPDTTVPVTGNFASGKLYVVALKIKAKSGYDISGLTAQKVSLDRSIMDMYEENVIDDETFSGTYMLGDAMQYTVTFDANGGSAIKPVLVGSGGVAKEPAAPTKAYFAFAGWYSDSGLTQAFDFNTPITGDITLYAKWTPSPVNGMFLMTIDFNGGTSTMPTVSEVPANSGIYLNDNLGNFVTPPSGKVLAGYEIDGVPYAAGGDYLVTQNFTLKFLWKDAPVTTYTVSFAANGGTGTMADVTGISGEYTLPANGFTAPAGKQFKAWSVGGVEKAVGDKITVTANTTVTAIWETIPAGHICDIKPVAKVEPSCTEGGKKAYYKCEGCGKFYEDALGSKLITDLAAWGNLDKLAHKDDNNDGKCDACEYNVGTTPTNPDNKPSDDVQSPQTGDNGMMWLLVALLFVSGFGVVATTIIVKKKSSAK